MVSGFCPAASPLRCEHSSPYFLVGLLLACPVLCRATDDGCCADHEVTSGTPDEHHTPAPSDDAASCICGGAIKATDNRIHGSRSGKPFTDTRHAPFRRPSGCIIPRSPCGTAVADHRPRKPAGEAPGVSTPSSSTSAADIPLAVIARLSTRPVPARPGLRSTPRKPITVEDQDDARRVLRVGPRTDIHLQGNKT